MKKLNTYRQSFLHFRIDWVIGLLGYWVILFLLALYSYSQIDLNLTLTSNPTYQVVQQQLIQLGYFNRPQSAYIFTGLLSALFLLYALVLYLVLKKKLSFQTIQYIVALSIVVGIVSYPAFSHDIFNYMFDARIVTEYGQNPYLTSAQDFPADLWVRFMHWTHRTYPYGPLWLFITLPFSYLGMGKFVLTLLLYKLLFAAFHIGNIWFIRRISQYTTRNPQLTIAAYALNPLVIIESVVSPHNEVVMTFFLLAAVYFLYQKQTARSLGHLFLSGGIKFITWILFPVFLFHERIIRRWGNDGFLFLAIITLLIPLSYVVVQREPYSWYALPLMALIALVSHHTWIRIMSSGISFGLLLRYAPFLYFGDYTDEMRMWQNVLVFTTLAVSCVWIYLSGRGANNT